MSTILILYALTASERVASFMVGLGVALIVITLIKYFISALMFDSYSEEILRNAEECLAKTHKFAKKASAASIILFILATLTPWTTLTAPSTLQTSSSNSWGSLWFNIGEIE